ncbi:hypothetical protein J6R97_07435, partial [bacterium]|nr:hypothetical protein [bacterium]
KIIFAILIFPSLRANAKQSRTFFHQTYFTGLLRRISSFLAETCAVSYSGGLHPVYITKRQVGKMLKRASL